MFGWYQWADPNRPAGQEIATLRGVGLGVADVAFSADGKRLYGAGSDGEIGIWNVETGELQQVTKTQEPIHSMAANSARTMLAIAASTDPPVQPISMFGISPLANEINLAEMPEFAFNEVCFGDGGKFLAASSTKHRAYLWDLKSGKPAILEHPEPLTSIALSPDEKWVATASNKVGLWLWDTETKKIDDEPLVKVNQGPWFCRVRFSPDGRYLLTASQDGTLRRWNLATRKFESSKGSEILCLAVSPDSRYVVIGQRNSELQLWSLSEFKQLATLKGHTSSVYGVTFSPDGKTIASGSFDGSCKLWNVEAVLKGSNTSERKP
jgi:WD40 repeat protein